MAEIWTILNCTPDSFYAPSRVDERSIGGVAQRALNEGASVLDIGGMSTRPGHTEVSTDEELARLDGALSGLPKAQWSVDTYRAEVVERLHQKHGPFVVNDVLGSALEAAATLNLPYVAMSNDGTMDELLRFFEQQLNRLAQLGHTAEVILDPGFGFGKTAAQNFEILAGLRTLKQFDKRILVGLSRKRMVWQTVQTTPEDALVGSSALHFEALKQGADILRVHDTVPAVQILQLYEAYRPYCD